MLVDRDRSPGTGMSAKTGVRDGSVLMYQRWLPWSNKLLPALMAGNQEEKIWNYEYPAAHVTKEPASIECRVSELHKKCKNEVGYIIVSFVRFETKWKHSCYVLRWLTKQFADPTVHRRMTGKFLLAVFGGSGFVTKATSHVGLCGCVLDTKFGPGYDMTPLVLTRIRQDFTSTSTQFVIFQSYFRQCCHR